MQIVRTIFVLLGGYLIAVFVASICVTSGFLLGNFHGLASEPHFYPLKMYLVVVIISFINIAVTALPGFLLSIAASYISRQNSHWFFSSAGAITALIAIFLLNTISPSGTNQTTQILNGLWLALIIVSGSVGGFAYALWHRRLFHRA
ncbi:hypothetical protein [Ahrensia kielensis]|uniref:hypothetical protein n=1 Tax=Ahrensia kielensis TaxID=76980 RepID=UPI00319EA3C9